MTNSRTTLEVDRTRSAARARPAERRGLRHTLEPIAIILMLLGYAMIFQPFVMILFTYSYTVMLIGTALYMVASHLRE
jgi:hypothetical protein